MAMTKANENEHRSYATQANAEKFILKTIGEQPVRWMVAVAPNGRFVPVVIGIENVRFAHLGIVVVG
jgi:hypothetical protein